MQPDSFKQQPLPPASLPAVPLMPNVAQTEGPLPPQPMQLTPEPSGQLADDITAQVDQLVQRYAGSPQQLAEAFNQFKSGYLAHHYHIIPNNTAGK